MKVGILTQPIYSNYGGILQAYALQTVLSRLGHDSIVIRRDPPYSSISFPNNIKLDLKYYLRMALRGNSVNFSARQINLYCTNTNKFVERYIRTSKSIITDKELINYTSREDFDAYVVGSDQVWRPAMSPNIFNFFLDFVPSDSHAKKIAYAASFGVDHWEFSEDETKVCASLAKLFDTISVREASGISLCDEHLGVEATHVLDPTLMLDKDDYIKLVNDADEPKTPHGLFCYVLDKSEEKTNVIRTISEKQNIADFYCMPKHEVTPANIKKYGKECIYPTVTQWLRSFMDAKMVLTDSFHGTAFSIIFNKPFWVIGNKKRGLSRFESLLGIFGLQDRLITPEQATNIDWNTPIDWNSVNTISKEWQDKSSNYLTSSLAK